MIIDCTTPVPPEPPMRDVAMVEHVAEAAAFKDILAELHTAAAACRDGETRVGEAAPGEEEKR